jgi:hypothetical protein
MKIATFAALAILLSTRSAYAGAGAPVPEKPAGGPPSGRPGAVLDDAKCKAVWGLTERQGDALAQDKAAQFIVDTNKDGLARCRLSSVMQRWGRKAAGRQSCSSRLQPGLPC